MMNVVLAEHAGACYGVRRALGMAKSVMESGKSASTLGPLIHNPQVVEELAEKGIHVAESPQEVKGGIVIIRSHGVTPDVRSSLEDLGFEIVDATCPHVAMAQKGAAELAGDGCHVLVVGEQGHPEVESLVAYALQQGADVDVVLDPSDIPDNVSGSVGVVVQTTQTRENLELIMAELKARGIEPALKDTICSATRHRQKAAAELAKNVDAMVVIGGRNSSNTTRLAEICSEYCDNTHHIESSSELDPSVFSNCETVGVTAGASTPEGQITEVIDILETMGE